MAPYWGFPSKKDEWNKMSLQEKKESTCREIEAPVTCPVPSVGQDVTYSDWLFRYTDWCDGCVELVFPTLAATSFIVLLIWTLVTALTGATLASLIVGAATAAIFTVCTYLTLIGKGQMLHAGDPAAFVADLRIRRISRRNLRRAVRKAKALDERTGWRPRQGIPHPKGFGDTYDRWLVEGHSTELGLLMGLRRWSLVDGFWEAQPGLTEDRWFEDDETEVEIAEHRAQLEGKARLLECASLDAASTRRAVQERSAEDGRSSNARLLQQMNDETAAVI